MEWNAKTSTLLWDWKSHVGTSYKLSSTSSGSELGDVCSSRSSISASIDSSSKARKGQALGFGVVANYESSCDESRLKDVGTGPSILTVSTGPKGSPVSLKLGKRSYFESTEVPAAVIRKTRISQQSVRSICCQVENCSNDLKTAKDYHRKHRVCEAHSKCSRVIVAGVERRFCQQCSRFQALTDFDDKKRSCRKRLSDHNARRRKAQPEIISFNPEDFSSPFFDKRQINFTWNNNTPSDHLIFNASSIWQSSFDYDFRHEKGPWLKVTKEGNVGDSANFASMQLSNGVGLPNHSQDVNMPFQFRGNNDEVHRGSEVSVSSSNLNGAPDLRHALSLLSGGYWVSPDPQQTPSLTTLVETNQNSAAQPTMQSVNFISGYWQDEKLLAKQPQYYPFPLQSNGNQIH